MKQDKSPRVPQRAKIKDSLEIRDYTNWTDKQKEFINIALDKNSKVLMVDGLWGTAKTFTSVYCALKLLNDKKVSDIFYLRNPVESSSVSKLGYIKGDISEKMSPYAAPFLDKLDEFLQKEDINKLLNDNRIHVLPVGYLRGLNWNSKAIIVDEASCFTYEDLLLIISRMGEFSKMFIIGDSFQNDIKEKSGFNKFFDLFSDQESKENGIFTFKFQEKTDIVRSKLLQFIMGKIKK